MDSLVAIGRGQAGCRVSRFGLGCAALKMNSGLEHRTEAGTTIARALMLGVNLIDTSPLYSSGWNERGIAKALSDIPRTSYVLSTKTGYVIGDAARAASSPSGSDQHHDRQQDFSYDFTMWSVRESLRWLRVERLEIVHVHAPSVHQIPEIVTGAYPALQELRRSGVVGAIGAGMTELDAACELVRTVDLDCMILACHYTLLMHPALDELFPLCLEKGVAVLAAGPFASGLLADPYAARPRFNYKPATPTWIEKAQRLDRTAKRFDVSLKAACLQFPLAHPAVVSILSGPGSVAELEENLKMFAHPIPVGFWDALRSDRLLADHVPTP